jgi:hypothetical protein
MICAGEFENTRAGAEQYAHGARNLRESLNEPEASAGRGQGGPCLTDAAQ